MNDASSKPNDRKRAYVPEVGDLGWNDVREALFGVVATDRSIGRCAGPMLFAAHEAEAQRCRPSNARDRRLRDEGIVAEVILAEGRQRDDRDDAELESGVRRAVRVVVQSGDRQRHGVAEPQVTPTSECSTQGNLPGAGRQASP